MIKHGTVYWITGFAGAGKTTIGKALFDRIKPLDHSTVLLDGDAMREAFGNDLGYTEEDRFKCAMRYSRICKLLSDQGINVICCTISMFNEVRKWNRENIGYGLPGFAEAVPDCSKERSIPARKFVVKKHLDQRKARSPLQESRRFQDSWR